MRRSLVFCGLIAFTATSSLLGQRVVPADTQQLGGSLQNADSAVRRLALEEFEKKVKRTLYPGNKPVPPESVRAINEAMALLGTALVDPDPDVRRAALAPLNDVATHQQAVTHGVNAAQPDMTSEPSIRQNLIKLMSDPDVETIRIPATAIYAQSFLPTPELEQQWMAEYQPGQSSANRVILAALMVNGSPSPAARAFVFDKLRDPATAYDAAEEIILCLKPPPAEALPLMIERFANSDKPAYRTFLAQAIPKFGPAAHAYLPLLQGMLARETDSIVRANLANAISSISAQSPPPSAKSVVNSPPTVATTSPSGAVSVPTAVQANNPKSVPATFFKNKWFIAAALIVLFGIVILYTRRAG